MPFEKWESGEELFGSLDQDADLLDRDVRVWAEECDQMQGIQMFTGGDDAWAGFAARYAENLRDEFGKIAIWVWGIEEESGTGPKEKHLLRTLNVARTVNEMSIHASMYIPISVPAAQLPSYMLLDRSSPWHTSALLAAAFESMTLPSRLRISTQKRGLLDDLEAALNVNGNQRLAQLECRIMDTEAKLPPSTTSEDQVDNRVPSDSSAGGDHDEQTTFNTHKDIHLSGSNQKNSQFPMKHPRSPDRIFGAIEGIRGFKNLIYVEGSRNEESTDTKRKRRFAGLPVVEMFVILVQSQIILHLTLH